jgi:hypothetical protein
VGEEGPKHCAIRPMSEYGQCFVVSSNRVNDCDGVELWRTEGRMEKDVGREDCHLWTVPARGPEAWRSHTPDHTAVTIRSVAG